MQANTARSTSKGANDALSPHENRIAIEPLATTYDKFTDDMQTTSEKPAKEQIEFKIEKQ